MSFSENAIVSLRNNKNLRNRRTFQNIENNSVRINKAHKPLSKSEQTKLDAILDKAEAKQNWTIRMYYATIIVLAALVFGYIVLFQW